MARRPGAREQELEAASRKGRRSCAPVAPGEAAAMLVRRGLGLRPSALDVPFPEDLDPATAGRLAAWLDHYAARLFLRGAIARREGFRPPEATRYVEPARAEALGRDLVDLGLAEVLGDRRLRLRFPARSFGGTLEWYVARELRERLGFDVLTGLAAGFPGVGGDLDVVAAAEGRLLFAEVKSSPPRHLAPGEAAAFFRRLRALRPDVGLFVVDTALRLDDRVLPLLLAAASSPLGEPRRLAHEVWALTPHLYVVGAKPDLLRNLRAAVAEGLRWLAPRPP